MVAASSTDDLMIPDEPAVNPEIYQRTPLCASCNFLICTHFRATFWKSHRANKIREAEYRKQNDGEVLKNRK